MKKKRSTILLIWLLVYLSIIPIQMPDYVLCIGADGHVEFEIGVNGRCTDLHDFHEEHIETVINAASVEAGHCGSCIDIAIFVPLNTEPYLVPVQNPLTPISVLVAALIADRTSASTILPHSPLPDLLSVINPTLISLRSTTLLI